MKRRLGLVGTAALGLVFALTAPAVAAGSSTIYVPNDFDPLLSDTRATGHYEVQGSGLHIWTDGAIGSQNKVAEYVDTDTSLADVAAADEPTLELTENSGTTPPGYQLVVDLDGDGTKDGILVGEPTYYGTDWWLADQSATFDYSDAPGAGHGYAHAGTLDEWSDAYPDANVLAFGFSLGSGVLGDWVIDAITFNGDRYTFAEAVTLTSKEQCKKGGWADSNQPVFRNQGDCVSSFASAK